MAGSDEVRVFTPTCPIGTPSTAPQVTNLIMPPRTVKHIRIRIPKGPNGVMGFALTSGGLNVIPYGAQAFIIASDEVIDWDPVDQIDSGSWQVAMYNTGLYPHTIYIQMTVAVPDVPDASAGIVPISIAPAPPVAPIVPVVGAGALPAPPEL